MMRRVVRLSQAALGAARTGATVYEIPPGKAVCPYHDEYGEEEWALVLAGRPSVRTPEGVDRLEPLDLVFFPPGPAGVHRIRNDGDEPARVLRRTWWSAAATPSTTTTARSDPPAAW